MNRRWYMGLLVVLALVVLTLVTSMLPWTARLAQASTNWEREYENSIGKNCPESKDKGYTNTYAWCNCTGYVALRAARAGVSASHYQSNGNAWEWIARVEGKKIPTGSIPKKGAVYVHDGHVMWVEEVLPDGSVRVSEYNYNFSGDYNTRTLNPTQAKRGKYIYFSNVDNSGGGNSGGSGAPSKPTGLDVNDIQRNKAKISWKKQSGVNYFCVNWSDKDETPNGCDVKVKDGSSYKPSNLKANTNYIVFLQACTSKGECSSHAKTKFKTKK